MKGLVLGRRPVTRPLNRLVNEAVQDDVEHGSAEGEADAAQIIEGVRDYRRSDPNFDRPLNEFVDAERATAMGLRWKAAGEEQPARCRRGWKHC